MKPRGWVELTQPNGVLCYYKAESIDRVGPCEEDGRGRAQTDLRVAGQLFRVRESPAQVMDKIAEEMRELR